MGFWADRALRMGGAGGGKLIDAVISCQGNTFVEFKRNLSVGLISSSFSPYVFCERPLGNRASSSLPLAKSNH